MNIYVFGNPDVVVDNKPFDFLEKLKADFPGVNFVIVKPNEDVPFDERKDVVILDTVMGLKKVTILDESSIDKLKHDSRASVHDYDLGFQLKYLKKIGKIGKVTIIGLPMNESISYDSIHSICKKLVAQDIHGS